MFENCDFFDGYYFKIEKEILNCIGFKLEIKKDKITNNKSTFQYLQQTPENLLKLIESEIYFKKNTFSKPPPKSKGADIYFTLDFNIKNFKKITNQTKLTDFFPKKNEMEIDENEKEKKFNLDEKNIKKFKKNSSLILKQVQIQNKCISKSTNSDIKNNGTGINDIKDEIKKAEPLYHDKFDILYLITSTKYDEDLTKKIESKNYFKKGEKFENYELKFNLFIMKTKDLKNLLGKNLFNFFLNFDPTKKNEFKFEYLNFLSEDEENKFGSSLRINGNCLN
jgi:hypothetical protein